ncbi:MAG: aminoacyl-histidine dipeptidase [Clostridium sp.]|uniref:aminoacyl-histidine dipeptidase n=1 Tax=Clostridium sp. TaxID=1506 RepID=UPI002FC8600F
MLENLNPKPVFKYFEEISKIPRGSKNEKAISDYLVEFAKQHSLEYIQDDYLNIIIRKPGTKGYENSKTVILQGHMDMVCEKNASSTHDFLNDPLKLRIDGDFIYATETTLGADNGVAIAYCLAILESNDIMHPPLEVLITTEEEIGMGGAINLSHNILKGDIMINIDSEEEGCLLVSCCGGIKTSITIDVTYDSLPKNFSELSLEIKGLKGGHSGMDIIKQRGNANIILGRLLKSLTKNYDLCLSYFNGGSKMNAIPREAFATIAVENNIIDEISKECINVFNSIKSEYIGVDDGIIFNINKTNTKKEFMTKYSSLNVINSLTVIPNGVITMSNQIKDLPVSSTNLGVVTTTNSSVVLESALRSSSKSLKDHLINIHSSIADSFNGSIKFEGDYPEWEYEVNSPIRNKFMSVYKDMFHKEPTISAIHAGLECGIIKSKYPSLDIISFGPNHFDVHSPDEHLSISSTERMYNYLLNVLKEIK